MAEDTTPPEAVDTKTETKAPVLDSNKPLTQQVDKLLQQLPEEKKEEPKEEPKDDAERAEDSTEEKQDEAEAESHEEEADRDEDLSEDDEEVPAPVGELPSWQQYVLENLPDIQTVGRVGEGKEKVFTVKRAQDLPDGFEFASKRDELIFNSAIAAQEITARELLGKYQQEEQQRQYQEFQNQEALDIQSDIQALQKEGLLPKFKYSESDPKFNDDPAVKEANAIYDIYKKTNDAYMKQYANTGRTYRISYRDAADKYYASQARTRTQAKPEQKPEARQERDRIASRTTPTQQSTDPTKQVKGIKTGTTMNDIYNLYKLGRI